MKFSVLIAHFNNFDYFKDCYHSLESQTNQAFEVIIVDDFSAEESYSKLLELTQNNPKYKVFRNEENKGVGYTKRKCVDLATGELCAFLDPDDALVSTAIDDTKKVFSQHSDIIATYSQLQLCNNNLVPQSVFKSSKKIKNNKPLFFNLKFEVAHFFSFKRATYLSTEGINPELTSAVDQDLYLKLYEKGHFYFIEKPLYLYRLHDKGVSQEKSKKEKLNKNWDKVIRDSIFRRKVSKIYGKNLAEINDFPKFILSKQNGLFQKIISKFS